MVLPAPGRFSTTTGCLRRIDSSAATTRAVTSPPPPGGKGTTSLMGREGQVDCASAGNKAAPSMAPAKAFNKVRFMVCLQCSWGRDLWDGRLRS
jgi:hypothetical protein